MMVLLQIVIMTKCSNTLSAVNKSMRDHSRVSVRLLASLVGQIIPMSVVLGNISLIITKFLSMDIAAAPHWDYYIKIPQERKDQINFWCNEMDCLNFKCIFDQPSSTRVVYSDASSYAYGGYEVSTVHSIAHGSWSSEEMLCSSTWRELTAVFRVLKSLAHLLKGNRVKWFTDNQSASKVASNKLNILKC